MPLGARMTSRSVALQVNPHDTQGTAQAINRELTMPLEKPMQDQAQLSRD
jgi:trehalose-6-phosphate synthase